MDNYFKNPGDYSYDKHSREGEVAVNNILGEEDHMRYDAIPGIVYTNPEVAGVGLTEEQAAASGKDYSVVKRCV